MTFNDLQWGEGVGGYGYFLEPHLKMCFETEFCVYALDFREFKDKHVKFSQDQPTLFV